MRKFKSIVWNILLIGILALLQPDGIEVLAAGRQTAPTLEQNTVRYFQAIREQPPLLLAFLREMPKGGDLHNHLSGSIYAESLIEWAIESGLCVDTKLLTAAAGVCDENKERPPMSVVQRDPVLYRQLIDSWSMRNWEFSGQNGHDHFFDTFGKFNAAERQRKGEMLAEAINRAAAENVSYMELMLTPDGGKAAQTGAKVGWTEDFTAMRQNLLNGGLPETVAAGRKALDEAEAKKNAMLKCSTVQAAPGCAVTVRYLYQVGRGLPREQVFAQILTGFEMTRADPRVVGLNLVMPEDAYVPMRDFSLHMRILDYLHSVYPNVSITLHAGELAAGLVPPEGLRFHIRDSIEKGHAKRIGHGVAVMHEDRPFELLKEMSGKKVMVEICLSSNDKILGIRGKYHPLPVYLQYGVPTALATDDEGVSRSDMTGELLRAVEDQGMDYLQLKAMARNSLEYAFCAGASLWKDAKAFVRVNACTKDRPGTATLSGSCKDYLARSEKARLQWKLEEALESFENKF